jgi:diguanylate cyclase (GGDEF)-like protein
MLWNRLRHSGEGAGSDLVGGELSALRAALDQVAFGVVLLDAELRAQFINRTFRKMWRLADAKADSKPAFVALMYHGRDTRAYAVPADELDAYVAERVARVQAGDAKPIDLRLANGEVIRFQCTVLPAGGRMLSYTYVTDIVRHSDELKLLSTALDRVDQGITLLDSQLNVQFMNRAVRELWKISDVQAARKPSLVELINDAHFTHTYAAPPEQLDALIARRIALVRAGDPTPVDLRVADGRIIRSQCAVLPGGGRMLTYADVTDLVRNAEELERLATIDGLTGICNRRHFMVLAEAEWSRFQRYHRPLSLLLVDIDHFKSINDRFGHDAGDRAIAHVADLCKDGKRGTDIVARVGGEEFVVLLPEADLAQAEQVAQRLHRKLADHPLVAGSGREAMTLSIGVSEATLSMSGIDALMKAADEALYLAKSSGRNRTVSAVARPASDCDLAAE